MGGRNTRPRVFRIRYRSKFGIRAKLVVSTSGRKLAFRNMVDGRILKVRKVPPAEQFHVGEYNSAIKNLMKELKQQRKGVVARQALESCSPED